MTIVLPALGVAFAGFCVWLTVRIYNRRERWAKWTAVGLLLVVIYALSVGPWVALLAYSDAPGGFTLGKFESATRFHSPVSSVVSIFPEASKLYWEYVLWSARTGDSIGRSMKR